MLKDYSDSATPMLKDAILKFKTIEEMQISKHKQAVLFLLLDDAAQEKLNEEEYVYFKVNYTNPTKFFELLKYKNI